MLSAILNIVESVYWPLPFSPNTIFYPLRATLHYATSSLGFRPVSRQICAGLRQVCDRPRLVSVMECGTYQIKYIARVLMPGRDVHRKRHSRGGRMTDDFYFRFRHWPHDLSPHRFGRLDTVPPCGGHALRTDLRHVTKTLRFTEDVKKNSIDNPTTQRHLASRTEVQLIVSRVAANDDAATMLTSLVISTNALITLFWATLYNLLVRLNYCGCSYRLYDPKFINHDRVNCLLTL